jgi:hypothetical protein
MRQWISVDDELPPLEHGGHYSTDVLIVVDWSKNGGGRLVRQGRLQKSGWMGEDDDTVTHWMFMPELPE